MQYIAQRESVVEQLATRPSGGCDVQTTTDKICLELLCFVIFNIAKQISSVDEMYSTIGYCVKWAVDQFGLGST